MKFKQIEVGYNFIIASTNTQKYYGWGSNEYGQLTINDSSVILSPKLLTELSKQQIIKISCGGNHSMGIYSDSFESVIQYKENTAT